MNVQCTSKLQRFCLSLIFTLTIAMTAPSVLAKKFDATNDILPLRSTPQHAFFPSTSASSNPWFAGGTQDLGALPTLAPPVLIAKANNRQPDHEMASTKIVVSQKTEPCIKISIASLTGKSFSTLSISHDWHVQLTKDQMVPIKAAKPPLKLQLSELASEEPLDVECLGPSVLVPEERIRIAPINPLIGSSPIIATIEESYMPYDLSAQDLERWNSLPLDSSPFAAGEDLQDAETAKLWNDFDTAMALSKSLDPAELNGIAKAKMGLANALENSPASPSDLRNVLTANSTSNRHQASQHDTSASVEALPDIVEEVAEIKPDEALEIVPLAESLALSPAPEHKETKEEPFADDAAGVQPTAAEVALRAILQRIPDGSSVPSFEAHEGLGTAAGQLLGSSHDRVRQWLSSRIALIAIHWPEQDDFEQPSRAGARLLGRANALDSGNIEDQMASSYIPIERLDGVDCGGGAVHSLADAVENTKAR